MLEAKTDPASVEFVDTETVEKVRAWLDWCRNGSRSGRELDLTIEEIASVVFEISRPQIEAEDGPEAEADHLQPEEVEEQDSQQILEGAEGEEHWEVQELETAPSDPDLEMKPEPPRPRPRTVFLSQQSIGQVNY